MKIRLSVDEISKDLFTPSEITVYKTGSEHFGDFNRNSMCGKKEERHTLFKKYRIKENQVKKIINYIPKPLNRT